MVDFSQNYFELFGMPTNFALDTGNLAARYRELQKVVHPDRYAMSGEHSQRLSLQHATFVNEAYQTLKDPLRRAQYLLELRDKEQVLQQATLNDPEFLMRQMELREALAEIPDAAAPDEVLSALMAEIDALIKAEVVRLTIQFEESSPKQLAAASQSVQKMQFLSKLRTEAEAIEADLEEDY